jgi:hypothetical protein
METLPGDVLLAIFNYYLEILDKDLPEKEREEAWLSLVHVCRRWRSIVFGSPRHLDLQLVCTPRTHARDTLDVWTALPLVIQCHDDHPIGNVDNIIAVLERTDRVRRIDLVGISSPNLDIVLAAMQQPFPELIFLRLWPYNGTVPVVSDSFLGGSASRLEGLEFGYIPFPGLPKLLLSATYLRFLRLMIPHSMYISPDAMVTILSTLTSLDSITLGFESPRSFPDRENRRLPPSTRSILPVLGFFRFKGVTEYLEDFVARIETPQLNELSITYFDNVTFDIPQVMQFISRTPMLRALQKVHITLCDQAAYVNFLSRTFGHGNLNVEILRAGLDGYWQVSSLEQVCASCMSPLSISEDLYMYNRPGWHLDWNDNIENGLWLELLHLFIGVKNLHLCEELATHIAPALRELVEARMTEVLLPTLENIYLEGLESSGPVEEGIEQFVAARQATSHPIAISRWANPGMEKISLYYVD